MTAEQSPQTRGSSTERAQTGHQSIAGFGSGALCEGLGDGADILSVSVALGPRIAFVERVRGPVGLVTGRSE
jgi:hypothetical protein